MNENVDIICKRISFMLNHPEYYSRIGRIDKEGFLLHGEPGCGKSHLVMTIASLFSLKVHYLNIGSFISDSLFLNAVQQIVHPSIILMEDIDCVGMTTTRSPGNATVGDYEVHISNGHSQVTESPSASKSGVHSQLNKGVSLSTLLNVLDGIMSDSGQIVIATTNYINKLDPALIRAGRFDTKIEIKPHTRKEVCEFIHHWYLPPDKISVDAVPEGIQLPVAKLIEICMNNPNMSDCIKQLNQLGGKYGESIRTETAITGS